MIIGSIVFYGQEVNTPHERLMFYNVENFFDTADDSLTDDAEFLPGGIKRWSKTRFTRTLEGLYKTIMAAGEWDPPVIVSFCEIENRKVLEALVYGTSLSKFGYRIIHEESPDRRGIDVCLIYRPDRITMIDSKYWIPGDQGPDDFTSRSVLYFRFAIRTDTIHLIMNHWPSRIGGVMAAADLREKIALMVKAKADSLCRENSLSKIIIAGDFNCTPQDHEMKILTGKEKINCSLVNLSDAAGSYNRGTYKYMGTWEMIDQVLVSDDILSCRQGLFADSSSLKIFSPPFLLVADEKYGGFKPFSTFSGYIYNGGFSDHLPVLLDLKQRMQK
jgi:hypothetical protein